MVWGLVPCPRLAIAALAAFALAACDQLGEAEEVRACRAFTQAQLRSPATYSEVEARTFDRPITEAELQELYFPDADNELDRIGMAMARGRRLQLRAVLLEHDAANAYGVPIRGRGGCEFLLIDGELAGRGSLEGRARLAASMAETARLSEALGNDELQRLARRRGNGLDCCVR